MAIQDSHEEMNGDPGPSTRREMTEKVMARLAKDFGDGPSLTPTLTDFAGLND